MPTGTPICCKCPKCKRGQWREPKPDLGTIIIGNGIRLVQSKHAGYGNGGSGFYGYPGLVKCLDCGHEWFSTLPSAGRVHERNAHPLKD
jgi:hypothetical protein